MSTDLITAPKSAPAGARTWRSQGRKFLPVIVTLLLLFAVLLGFSIPYPSLLAPQVFFDILISNAHLIVLAVGMTFVILTGGIDLSVGAVVALSTMIAASMLNAGLPAYVAIPAMIGGGVGIGLLVGVMVHFFKVQPFIASLAGMFLARGMCYIISLSSIPITDPFFKSLAQTKFYFLFPGFSDGGFSLQECRLTPSVMIALVVLIIGFIVLQFTRLGRTVYAIGESESSAVLMGLPVRRTKLTVYLVSGLCGSIGGFLFALNTPSGYSLTALGMELDVIAAVVIGGTVLTGGYGYVLGSLLGVLVLGSIQTVIIFNGELSSWWTKIFIGALLLVFVVMQRFLSRRKT